MELDDLQVWPLAEDMESFEAAASSRNLKKKRDWEPIFVSEGFFSPQDQPKVEDYKLKDRKLRMLGQRVTSYRQKFTEAAEK